MHITLISYVQVPATYISKLALPFFKHFVCMFFIIFWGF